MAEQTHVLFVEDDDVIREATQLALERDGFAVTAMPDGLSGLEAFRANRPDIALLDVMVTEACAAAVLAATAAWIAAQATIITI